MSSYSGNGDHACVSMTIASDPQPECIHEHHAQLCSFVTHFSADDCLHAQVGSVHVMPTAC